MLRFSKVSLYRIYRRDYKNRSKYVRAVETIANSYLSLTVKSLTTSSYFDMTMMRKVLFFLLATFAAASASTFHVQQVVTKPTAFRPKQAVEIPRGGGMDIDTSMVVKAHGYTAGLISALWVMETFGVEIPLVGLAATMEDFVMNDVTTFFIRFLASSFLFVNLVEVSMADNAQVQQFFKVYHVPAALAAIIFAKDNAKGPLGYMLPVLISAFTIGGFVL